MPNENLQIFTLTEDALRVQMETLQARITVHGNRMWQLPFTYVSFAAIAASIAVQGQEHFLTSVFFWLLAVAGIVVMWAMSDAWKSYKRTAENMNEVEEQLGLTKYTTANFGHALPHFVLCGGAVFTLVIAGAAI